MKFFYVDMYYTKNFTFFQLNQPIDYNNNLNLYYNYFIYYLYDTVIQVKKNPKNNIKKIKIEFILLFKEIS